MSMLESEIKELALKVKALEGQKKNAGDEAQRIIAAQRNNTETLRMENEHIQEQLRKDVQGSGPTPSSDRMDKLYDLVDTYTRKEPSSISCSLLTLIITIAPD
eukprot:gene17645-23989_t